MSLSSQISLLATRVGQEIKSLRATVNSKAPLASPTFTGTPAAPTATAGTNTTQVATTAFVATALASVSAGVTVAATQPATMATGAMWLDSSVAI